MKRVTYTSYEARPLAPGELREAARLHVRELPHEFLTRFGPGFIARYYRAFVESPHATALAVTDPDTRRPGGVLLGTFDTGAHYAFLVRRHGVALAGHATLQAMRDPALARDLLKTRLHRYLRGIFRSVGFEKESEPASDRVGFMAYIAVAGDRRSRGMGGALIRAYEDLARRRGLDRLELVTLPDERGAGPFYSRAGWTHEGERTSRSGERYALYARVLHD